MPVQEQNIIGHRAESSSILQSGGKEKRAASHEYVEGLSRNLMSGHASWNDTSVFGESGAALAKTAGLGISSYHQEDFEIEDPVLHIRQIKKTKKHIRDVDSATTTASSAATTNLNKRKAPPSVTSTFSSTPLKALGASATDADETPPSGGRKGRRVLFDPESMSDATVMKLTGDLMNMQSDVEVVLARCSKFIQACDGDDIKFKKPLESLKRRVDGLAAWKGLDDLSLVNQLLDVEGISVNEATARVEASRDELKVEAFARSFNENKG
jgi:hypothetical protein